MTRGRRLILRLENPVIVSTVPLHLVLDEYRCGWHLLD